MKMTDEQHERLLFGGKRRELPKWARRLLVLNRKAVMETVPIVYVVGVVFIAVFGAQAIAGEWSLYIDVTKYPFWLGYLMFYGAMVLMLMFVVEWVRQVATTARIRRRAR